MRISSNTPNSKKKKEDQKSKSRSKSKSLSGSRVENKFYFCHYKNAMYMGGMKSFQKNGKGILIHDNGTSVVCSYYNDFKDGHNILYTENCLMSIFYERNRMSECVFRQPDYLLYVKYNKQSQPDGKAILIDYLNRSIIYVTYKKGIIVQKKQEKQYSVINRVFDLQNFQFLIGITHSKALRFEIDDNQTISCQKSGTKFNVGFYKRSLLNGIGFTLLIKQPGVNADTHRNGSSFYLKPLQRGYFHNSQLSGMGQKWFKNGNYYFGDFKDNIFQGRGLLKNSAKNNWVYGTFQRGNMSQLIQYSHEGDLAKFKRIIETMHERKSSWINYEISLENPQMFINEIQKILNHRANAQIKSLQQRKQQVLKKIQQNFICDNQAESPLVSSRNILSYQQISADQKIQKPQELNLNNFHAKYNHPQKNDSQFQSPNSNSPNNQLLESPQKGSEYEQPIHPQTIYKIKLLPVPNSNDSTNAKSGNKRGTSASPAKYSSNQPSNRLAVSQKSMGFSQIKEESPSFKLDSKRMIGRSRLFKYMGSSSEQEPPRFNYVPIK